MSFVQCGAAVPAAFSPKRPPSRFPLVHFLLPKPGVIFKCACRGDDLDQDTLLHSSEFEFNGELFSIKIFCSAAGRFFAKTCLGEGDFIITDGSSAPDALKKHEELLPLAVGTRELTQSYLGSSRRSKGRRS